MKRIQALREISQYLIEQILLKFDVEASDVKRIVKAPSLCASRMADDYLSRNEEGLEKDEKRLIIIAATSLAFGAFALDDEIEARIPVALWLKLAGFKYPRSDEDSEEFIRNKELLVHFQLELFRSEEYDLCRREIGHVIYKKNTKRASSLNDRLLIQSSKKFRKFYSH